MRHTKQQMDLFSYFREAWSPRASWHLTNVRAGNEWASRFVSAVWLLSKRIPLTGAAPSMNFKGIK